MSSDGENHNDDDNCNGDLGDEYFYTVPDVKVPEFLNTDYKWNKTVVDCDTIHKYCNMIGKLTHLNMETEEKRVLMLHLTTDITLYHRTFIPHWKLLQCHAYFDHMDIL